MDFEKLTKRINRKLGFPGIVNVEDVKKLWVMAGDFFESKGIELHSEVEELFKKRWIQCRVKQMPEYWTHEVMSKFSDLGYVPFLFSDLEEIGKEDEEILIIKLDLLK